MIDAPEIKRKTTGTDLIRAIFWPTDYYHFPDLLLRMLVKFLYTIIRINNPLFVKRLNRDFIDLQILLHHSSLTSPGLLLVVLVTEARSSPPVTRISECIER